MTTYLQTEKCAASACTRKVHAISVGQTKIQKAHVSLNGCRIETCMAGGTVKGLQLKIMTVSVRHRNQATSKIIQNLKCDTLKC
jgi:hypothetical protein